MKSHRFSVFAVADPDFELRREPGFILLAQPAFLPSVISVISPKIRFKV